MFLGENPIVSRENPMVSRENPLQMLDFLLPCLMTGTQLMSICVWISSDLLLKFYRIPPKQKGT
jgi:hypothetical protein